jgi:hypothetical protein
VEPRILIWENRDILQLSSELLFDEGLARWHLVLCITTSGSNSLQMEQLFMLSGAPTASSCCWQNICVCCKKKPTYECPITTVSGNCRIGVFSALHGNTLKHSCYLLHWWRLGLVKSVIVRAQKSRWDPTVLPVFYAAPTPCRGWPVRLIIICALSRLVGGSVFPSWDFLSVVVSITLALESLVS